MEGNEKKKEDFTSKPPPSSSSSDEEISVTQFDSYQDKEKIKRELEEIGSIHSSIPTLKPVTITPQVPASDSSEKVTFQRKLDQDKKETKADIWIPTTGEPSKSSKSNIPISTTTDDKSVPKEITWVKQPSTSDVLHATRSKSQTSQLFRTNDSSPAISSNDIHTIPKPSKLGPQISQPSNKPSRKSSLTISDPKTLKTPEPTMGVVSNQFLLKDSTPHKTEVVSIKKSPTKSSQREARDVSPVISFIQDIIVPRTTLQSEPTISKRIDKQPLRPDTPTTAPSTDSRDPQLSSRSISLDRVSSRMDVRVITQEERATSQGDVQPLRVVDAVVTDRAREEQSVGTTIAGTTSRGDTSPQNLIASDRTSTQNLSRSQAPDLGKTDSIITPPRQFRTDDPERASVHTTRSILRKPETMQDTLNRNSSRRFSFIDQDATPGEEMLSRAIAMDVEQMSGNVNLKRTFSRITFPSLESMDTTTSMSRPQSKLKLKRSSLKSNRKSSWASPSSHGSRTTTTTSDSYTDISLQSISPTNCTYIEDLEEAHQRLGGNSLATWKILIAACAPGFINMWLLASTVLITSLVRYRCKIDELDEANWNELDQRDLLGVRYDENVCFVPKIDYKELSHLPYDVALPKARTAMIFSEQEPCKELVFESGNTTFVAEFKLVCGREDLLLLFQVVAGIGMGLGAICFGFLSDHFGRKPVFIVSLVMYTLCFPMSVIIPDYWAITVSHFLCGFANSGCFISAMVIMIEWSRASNRPVIGVMMFMPWGIGLAFISIVAFYVTEWWYLQITIAIPAAALLVCAFVLPESPRWLNAIGRRERAWRIIQKIRKDIRPVEEPVDDVLLPGSERRIDTSRKYWGYLSTKRELRLRLIICMLAGFGAGAIYFLVSLRAGRYGILVHFLLAMCGVLEMVACALTIVLLSVFGPRPTSSVLFLVCGAAVSFSSLVPNNMFTIILFLLLLARFISCILFFIVVIQTVELFPTLVRASALGIVLMFTYIFGLVIPIIVVGSSQSVNQSAVRNTYCAYAVVCGVVVLLLPCTRRRFLTDTMEHVDQEAQRGVQVSCRNLYARD